MGGIRRCISKRDPEENVMVNFWSIRLVSQRIIHSGDCFLDATHLTYVYNCIMT